MNELDLNLKLLRGKGIEIDKVGTIYPVRMDVIEEISIFKYNQYLNILCIEKNEIKKILKTDEDISTFKFIYLYCYKSLEYKTIILEALEFFFKEKVTFHKDYGFYLGDINELRFITLENYEEIKIIIKKMNCLVSIHVEDEEEDDDEYGTPHNERARAIIEKLKKDKKTRKKLKKKEAEKEKKESLDLYDLISILSAYGNGIDIFNVWDLTFFQFNNQFNRMRILKDFEVNVQVLLNTTEPDKIHYQHWLSKIVKEEN